MFWINLNPTAGSEINKKRPCVIISPKAMNKHLNTVIVAPLTTTLKKYPTRLTVTVNNRKGQIVLDQIRTLDKSRLGQRMTTLDAKTVKQLKQLLWTIFE